MKHPRKAISKNRQFLRQAWRDEGMRKRFLLPILFSLTVFYFAYHSLNGERGLYAYLKQSRNLEVSQIELAKLTDERSELEQRVKMLSSDSLDLDLLDEEARRVLGSAKKNEVVVLVSPR